MVRTDRPAMRCVIKGLNCIFHFSVQKDVETEMKEEAWTHIVKSKFILGVHRFRFTNIFSVNV